MEKNIVSFQLNTSSFTILEFKLHIMISYVIFNCPAKPVSPYFFAITPAIRPQTARSTLYIFTVLLTAFSFSMASAIWTKVFYITDLCMTYFYKVQNYFLQLFFSIENITELVKQLLKLEILGIQL